MAATHGSIPRWETSLGKRFDVRLACPLVLVACLAPAAARESAAQQLGSFSNQELAGACSFRNVSGCARLAARIWDSFASAALGTMQPTSANSPIMRADAPIVRDGTFVHSNARAFYMLKGLVPLNLGPDTCGQLRADRKQLTDLVCNATLQLRPSGPNEWRQENAELGDLRRRLVSAGCVDASPDPCAPVVALAPAVGAELEIPDSADEAVPEFPVDLQ